jgi:hypothetical protein
MMPSSTVVEQDKAEIVDLLNLYGFALDSHSWGLFDRIFTEDVLAEFGPAGSVWTGLPTLIREFKVFHEQLDNHQHTMMGQLVRVDGDVAHAFSYGNWLLVRFAAGDDPNWTGTGWYDDVLVRTDRGWRISHRICRLVSWAGNPLVSEPEYKHNPDMRLNVLSTQAAEGKIRFLAALAAEESGPDNR